MNNVYLESFSANCNLCPDEKIAKCNAIASEIVALEGMEWPADLEYERKNMLAQRETAVKRQTPVRCLGPWIVRQENNTLVCGQVSGYAMVDMKNKNYNVVVYDRADDGDYAIRRVKI